MSSFVANELSAFEDGEKAAEGVARTAFSLTSGGQLRCLLVLVLNLLPIVIVVCQFSRSVKY